MPDNVTPLLDVVRALTGFACVYEKFELVVFVFDLAVDLAYDVLFSLDPLRIDCD